MFPLNMNGDFQNLKQHAQSAGLRNVKRLD